MTVSNNHAQPRPSIGPERSEPEVEPVTRPRRVPRALPLLVVAIPLAGCSWSVLDPRGPIGRAELDTIVLSTWLMLAIVVPVIALTLAFAWHYRASNLRARYEPEWDRSVKIAAVMVLVPLTIITILGVVTWQSTHRLDPYRPIASDKQPLTIDVVAMDWKWLFIYPNQRIAAVNRVVLPTDTPVHFNITATSVMNSFLIPQLGGQIYAMPGMQTQLHLIADRPGTYDGLSANYSGAGFSDMKFKAVAMNPRDFSAWVASAKRSPETLGAARYNALAAPSQANPVVVFSSVDPGLYDRVLRQYRAPDTQMSMANPVRFQRKE